MLHKWHARGKAIIAWANEHPLFHGEQSGAKLRPVRKKFRLTIITGWFLALDENGF